MEWINSYLKKHPIMSEYSKNSHSFSHLTKTQEALLAIGYVKSYKKPLMIVKENEQQASELIQEIIRMNHELNVVYYSQEESLRVEAITQSEVLRAQRIQALYQIITNNYDICVTHAVASVRKISPHDVLKETIIPLEVGQDLPLEQLTKRLDQMGYTRAKYVEQPFTYALRGGVCDVYSVQMENPLRIEFFDTEIDSMRTFDSATQQSIEAVKQAEIIFAQDIILDEETCQNLAAKLIIKETDDESRYDLEVILEMLKMGNYDINMYPLLYHWDEYETIFEYCDTAKKSISTIEGFKRTLRQNEEDVFQFVEDHYNDSVYIESSKIYASMNPYLEQETIQYTHEYQSSDDVVIPWHQANIISDNLNETVLWLKKEAITQKVILALDSESMETMINTLISMNVSYQLETQQPQKNGIYIVYSEIETGFILDDIQTMVLTKTELFQYARKRFKYDNKFSKAETLNQLQDLDTFDYVVHRQYGIGKYMGIETKEIDGIQKDFMRIMYRDGDELFVPLEQFTLVRKYLSSHATAVRLSKLGSKSWEKSKEKIQKDVAEVADRLVALYATRMKSKGHAFSPDNDYQRQFESEFKYDLTKDQEVAIQEIKADMESELPMDRLLCGDVGFGKTEVAIRAAFKAFVDGKQVAFLCPTTILSAQHTRTLRKRFENYPIRVEVLNRFVSDKEAKAIVADVKAGKVDILVGTHRLLSKDIKFHDLGLLIIDEEQRFGVEHKERIKEFKVSVDVLSLSATPIPRTLQMSLIGLRSLSQLNTPPSNRLPVMTYVIEKNKKTLHDIMIKELNRDGQVFYLFNNVEQIYEVANSIARAIPQSKVAVVHGQMDRYEIEDVMMQFIAKEVNVLVCTTIIETGIDIPNANTIIVENAHRFGLSQLYQIKGRVGRSDRLAYAYFVVPEKKGLSEVAQKRLQAIKEFTQLGSGYKIAMRDLTIRGAGELLGGNQSGFIDTVGIDLYIELLKEAIDERQGTKTQPLKDTESYNLKIDAYLPDKFTSDDGEKLDLYQQIYQIETLDELKTFNEMVVDRYGQLPNAVTMLLEKKRLELFLNDERIKSFKERMNKVEVSFTEEYSSRIDGIKLFELISEKSSEINVKYVSQSIKISMPMYDEWVEDLIYILENMKEKSE